MLLPQEISGAGVGAGKWKLLSQRRALRQDVFPFRSRRGVAQVVPGSGAGFCSMMYRHCRIWVGMRNCLGRGWGRGFCGFAGVVFAFAMQECGLIMRPSAAAGGFKFERHLS